MNPKTVQWTVIGAAVGIVGWLIFKYGDGVAEKVAGVAEALNPMSGENIFYQTGNAVVGLATGKHDETLGGILADWFDPNAKAVNALYGKDQNSVPASTTKIMSKAPTTKETVVFNNSGSLIH